MLNLAVHGPARPGPAHPLVRGHRASQHDRILVTRNGRPSFVLLSPDDLASLEETLAILQDAELMDSLRTSRQQAAAGDTVSLRDQV